jgi:hypothetical protein
MTIDEAITELTNRITGVCADAVIRVSRISSEEARIRAYAAAAFDEPIKDATRDLTIQFLTAEGLDIQVIPYDIATSLPPDE